MRSPRLLVCSSLPLLAATLASPVRAYDGAVLAERARLLAQERGSIDETLLEREGTLRALGKARAKAALRPRECVVASLVLSEGEAQLGLKTRSSEMLWDRDSGPIARLRYCAGEEGETLRFHVASDSAARFALGVFKVGEGAKASASSPHVPQPTVEEAKEEPSLAGQLAALASQGPRLEPMAPAREEDLGRKDPRHRELVLEAGRCYRVLAVGEPEVQAIELLIGGQQHSPPAGTQTTPSVRSGLFCAQDTSVSPLEVRVLGSGRVLWQLFSEAQPDAVTYYPVGGSDDTLVGRRLRARHARSDRDKPPVMAFVRHKLALDGVSEARFPVELGKCYTAIGAAVGTVRALELSLYDERGELIAQMREEGESARVSACAARKGTFRLRTRALTGSGEVGVQAFVAR